MYDGEQVLILFLVLEDIDPNKVYILGGLVDESIHKVGRNLSEPEAAVCPILS